MSNDPVRDFAFDAAQRRVKDAEWLMLVEGMLVVRIRGGSSFFAVETLRGTKRTHGS